MLVNLNTYKTMTRDSFGRSVDYLCSPFRVRYEIRPGASVLSELESQGYALSGYTKGFLAVSPYATVIYITDPPIVCFCAETVAGAWCVRYDKLFKPGGDLLSVRDSALQLRCTPKTIRNYLDKGLLSVAERSEGNGEIWISADSVGRLSSAIEFRQVDRFLQTKVFQEWLREGQA